jgi:hypothetical protein
MFLDGVEQPLGALVIAAVPVEPASERSEFLGAHEQLLAPSR